MGKYQALILANHQYPQDEFSYLKEAINDAKELSQVLEKHAIAPFEIEQCFDYKNCDALNRVGEFFLSASPDDFLLFYFSGHARKDDEGDLYLAMSNTEVKKLLWTGLPAFSLNKIINNSPSRRKVIVLDACYSAAFVKGTRAGHRDIEIPKYIQQGTGTVVLTSSNAAEVSYDREDRPSFTHFLVEGLKTGTADHDKEGRISVEQWFGYAAKKVAGWQKAELYYYRHDLAPIYIGVKSAPKEDGNITTENDYDEPAPSQLFSNIYSNRLGEVPLECSARLVMQGDEPFILFSFVNVSSETLKQVQIMGVGQVSAQWHLLETIQTQSSGEALECLVPCFIRSGQILFLGITALDTLGRAFGQKVYGLSDIIDQIALSRTPKTLTGNSKVRETINDDDYDEDRSHFDRKRESH